MSEEMKAGINLGAEQAAPADTQPSRAQNVSERLNTAASAMERANRDAKERQRRERQKKQENSKLERQKQQDAERRREEEEQQRLAAREKKLQALAYAENYRQRQKEEQERLRAMRDAKRKARAEALAKQREEEERLRKEADAAAALDAEKRNAENEELLRRFNEKQEADRLMREEMMNAPKPERTAGEAEPIGPIYITEDGRELLAAIEPEEIERRKKAEVKEAAKEEEAESADDSADDALPSWGGIDLSFLDGIGGSLSSEAALEEMNSPKEEEEPKEEEPAVAESEPEAIEEPVPEEPEDYNIELEGRELISAVEPTLIQRAPARESAEEAAPETAPEEPEVAEEKTEEQKATEEEPEANDAPLATYEGIDLSALAIIGENLSSEEALDTLLNKTAESELTPEEEPKAEQTTDAAPEVADKKEEPVEYNIEIDGATLISAVELKQAEKVEESAPAEEKVEEPAPAEEKVEEPAPAEEKVEEPAPAEKKVEEPAPAEEKVEEPAPAVEKASEPKESEKVSATKVKKTVKKIKKVKTRTVSAPSEVKAEEKKPEPEAEPEIKLEVRKPTGRLAMLLAGYGTYELVTTKADFGDEFIEKKRSVGDVMAATEKAKAEKKTLADKKAEDSKKDANAAEAKPAAEVKLPTILLENDGYEYDAGFVYTYEALGLVNKKAERKKKREKKKALKALCKKNKKRAKYGLPPIYPEGTEEAELTGSTSAVSEASEGDALKAAAVVAAGAAVGVAVANADDISAENAELATEAARSEARDERLQRIEALKTETERLKDEISENESKNSEEISALKEKEHELKMNAYEAELAAKEADYQRELDELNARRNEMARRHEEQKLELESAISGYENAYDDITGAPTELVARGTDGKHRISVSYQQSPDALATARSREYEAVGGKHTEKGALQAVAGAVVADLNVDRMNKKELSRRLAKASKREQKLIKRDKKLSRRRGDTATVLAERMQVKRELLQSYISDLNYAMVADSNKYVKKYSKMVAETTGEYNGLIDAFSEVTGTTAPTVDERITEKIVSGEGTPPIPVISYAPEGALGSRLTREDKIERGREQLRFLKDDKRIRREEKQGIRRTPAPESLVATEKIVKRQMADDLSCAKARIKYREASIKYELSLSQFHFDQQTKAKRRDRADSSAKLKAMRRDAPKLLKLTKYDNKRYAKVMAGVDISSVKNPADRERLALLRQRIIALATERDDINKRLMTLYTDDGKGKKNIRDKVANVRLKAAKRSFNKQLRLFKKSRKYHVNITLKEQLWGLMNERTDLAAYLAECKYRKRNERPKGAVKRWLKTEIRSTKKNIKYAERDIYKLMKKAKKSNAKKPNVRAQIIWTVILALMVAGVIAAVVFWPEISAFISSLISSFIK